MHELLSILGKSVESAEVLAVLRQIGHFTPSIQDLAPDENMRPDHYLTDKSRGIQLRHAPSGEVEVVFLYGSGKDGFSQYQGSLGSGVSFFSSPQQVLAAHGEPAFHKPQREVHGLGIVGETLRYDYPKHSLSFQARPHGKGLLLVTLMASHVVPGRANISFKADASGAA